MLLTPGVRNPINVDLKSQENFKKAMQIKPVAPEAELTNKKPVICASSLTAFEKEQILKTVDLNKMIKAMKTGRK